MYATCVRIGMRGSVNAFRHVLYACGAVPLTLISTFRAFCNNELAKVCIPTGVRVRSAGDWLVSLNCVRNVFDS